MTRRMTCLVAGVLALAGCNPGPGHVPYTPSAAQGGGAAALQGGSSGGTATSRLPSSPAIPGSLTR